MVQSPSWEANWFAASQENPRILWNPKVHYRTHKRPPPVPILDQPNPVHISTSHLLEIHPNIIHPSTPRSPQWSLSHSDTNLLIYYNYCISLKAPLLPNVANEWFAFRKSRVDVSVMWQSGQWSLLFLLSSPSPQADNGVVRLETGHDHCTI